MSTSRGSGFAYQRLISVVGVYFAGGWGLIEFIDWISSRYDVVPAASTVFLVGWLLGLPLLTFAAVRSARRVVTAAPSADESAGTAGGAASPTTTGVAPGPGAAGAADTAGVAGIARTTGVAEPSVAVLPLVSLSASPDDAYLSGGITDEIVNTLGRLEGLKVASRTSAAAYAGRERDVRQVGRELGVSAVLEGSLQRAGGRLRVNTQLVDVASGHYLWAERFDAPMDDVFAVEDRIAGSVATALCGILKEQDRTMIARSPTRHVHAYEHYLRGRQFLYQTRRKSLLYARDMFIRATQLDDDFALAWAGLADANAMLRMYYPGEGDGDEAAAAADRALALAPDYAETHSALGAARFMRGEFDAAEAAFRTAMRMDRRLFEPRYYCARMLFQQGRFAEAARLFQEALAAREDYQAAFFAAQSLEAMGDPASAAAQYANALAVVERHMELNPDDARAATMRAVALCRIGRTSEGFSWAERALFADPEDAGVRYNVACLYAVGGAAERAIDCLELAVQAGFGNRDWLERDPDLESVRDNPRFAGLLSRM